MLPAIAQGAIGIEQRAGDDRVAALLAAIHDAATGHRLAAERAFLAGLDGSCQTPIAGLAELDGDRLRLRGEILRPDGSECLTRAVEGAVADAAALGAALRRRAARPRRPGLLRRLKPRAQSDQQRCTTTLLTLAEPISAAPQVAATSTRSQGANAAGHAAISPGSAASSAQRTAATSAGSGATPSPGGASATSTSTRCSR